MTNKITKNRLNSMGLKEEDYNEIIYLLGREPTLTEVAIFSAMWSEHCSYKSSRHWLKELPCQAKYVIQGPGENAGVIDIGKENAIVFKIESHNHPSFIEPYQGAATGVGGIMRDIFTMGARPIANLNCLRFGDISHKKSKYLFNGVVKGVGDYGNCTGIPTVGGECTFDKRYNNNILVNAMTVGITKKNKIFYARAGKAGNIVIYVGSKTGRDGIHGASMSSDSFSSEKIKLKPTVQVGDPFTEKLLMEACIELMNSNAVVGIQDMGAAGLTSSAVEVAASSNLGIQLNLDKVPLRDNTMVPDEIMLSESQERMLIILKPEKVNIAKKIFKKWSLDFERIGKVIKKENIVITFRGKKICDTPIKSLVSVKKFKRNFVVSTRQFKKKSYKKRTISDLIKIIFKDPNFGCKSVIWEQYDHMISRNVLSEMGGNASIIKTGSDYQAIAITTDCNIFYCDIDPYHGAIQAISESYRNLVSVGAKPLAITNCLNFGNPEKSEIMGEFVQTIRGMKIASYNLNLPIISGNVSFYNETNDLSIPPTPQIGAVGLIDDYRKTSRFNSYIEDDIIFVLGETKGHLSGSAYERCFFKFDAIKKNSKVPEVNFDLEKKVANAVNHLISKGLISSCHDISDGGVAVALIEMCIAKNRSIEFIKKKFSTTFLFAEDQSRYIVSIHPELVKQVEHFLNKQQVHFDKIGKVLPHSFKVLNFPDKSFISLKNLTNIRNKWLKRLDN
tara:strand:+ start:2377 stop:4569 length:2193 start_codon:yes stop_codon:yes gene_type:complete